MQVSKQLLNPNLEAQLYRMWHQLVADVKNPEEAETVCLSLFSQTELVTIVKRLGKIHIEERRGRTFNAQWESVGRCNPCAHAKVWIEGSFVEISSGGGSLTTCFG